MESVSLPLGVVAGHPSNYLSSGQTFPSRSASEVPNTDVLEEFSSIYRREGIYVSNSSGRQIQVVEKHSFTPRFY